jgi:outer membrane protein OmpA-like peptidoglycan-associated protein
MASASVAAPAQAQVGFALHLEGGGALMLSSHQREVLDYQHGFTGMVRPELRLGEAFGLEFSGGALWFPSDAGDGRVVLAGGGFRLEPMLGTVGRLVLDAHGSYAYTGVVSRFALDFGVALEFRATENVVLGPYVRYTHVFAANDGDGSDAMMLTYGLTLALGTSAGESPDSDGDGVNDDVDVCPNEPAGESRDPDRLGCPRRDSDNDGVDDSRDLCVNEPVGDVADPERLGCPLVDTDRDGVSDRNDLCPNEPAGANPDPDRAGCPRVDTDGDGVFDSSDVCPTTAAGPHPDPARSGCPDGDDDGDGFLNSIDQCPTVHADSGFNPDPARPGCPLPDRDHDTVPDSVDACPDVAGAPSANPRRNGCPGLVVVGIDHLTIERPLYFATGRDTILRRSNDVLLALADALRMTPRIHRVSIEGHTDDVGDDAANLALSERRAASVMKWLVDHGIEASRLEAHGFGESRPVATGISASAREQNRRVAILVTDPAPPSMEGVSQ